MADQFQPEFRPDLPPPVKRWSGFPTYNFVGGHNDPTQIPVDDLVAAAKSVLAREGRDLAMYGLKNGPQGYQPLRNFIAEELTTRTKMLCNADDVLLVSGSLQALDLVFETFLDAGDSIIIEEACYGGCLSWYSRHSIIPIGIEVDQDGMRMDHLAEVLGELAGEGRLPKMIYTIPTVQNPTGTVMSEERRHELLRLSALYDLPVFEDDCYANLLWDGQRPPAIRALDQDGRVAYCGSFSKTIAPALRVGYLVADWPILSQVMALKTDAGSGAMEQMLLAEYATKFGDHVDELTSVLKDKCEMLVGALAEQFGAQVECIMPKGGIFVWVTFPDEVDTDRLATVALAEGVEINAGSQWSADPETGRRRARLCFGSATKQEITEGVARLAEICHREFGIPARSSNVAR